MLMNNEYVTSQMINSCLRSLSASSVTNGSSAVERQLGFSRCRSLTDLTSKTRRKFLFFLMTEFIDRNSFSRKKIRV